MAPKRRPRKAVKTVVTTKKVVEETVQVVVTPQSDYENVDFDLVSKNVEILTSPEKESVSRTIPVEEHVDEDETQPETAPTPPQKEAPPPKPAEPETPQVKGKKETRKTKTENGPTKKRRKLFSGAGGREGYKRYVFKVMKQVHPDMGISSKAMTVINNLMWDMFERLAEEAARLQKYTGRRTMSGREVQAAVKLVLPGELGKHAIAEGTKAVSNYVSNVNISSGKGKV